MHRRGIFFDLYGTLLIYGDMTAAWTAWLRALHGWLNDLGVQIERDDLAARCEGFFSRPEPVSRLDGLTLYEERLRAFCSELGLAPESRELSHAARTTVASWQRFVELDPDAPPVLETLADLGRLALVSNFDHPPHVEKVLHETGLDRHFDCVVISGAVGVKKPDPRIFDSALASLDLAPDQVTFVGDAPEDVQAAHAAGMTPIRIRRDGDTESDKAADFRHAATAPDWSTTDPHLEVSTLRQVAGLLANPTG